MPDIVLDLIVIGGGAAGIYAALIAGAERRGGSILVLEKGHTLLGKVRVSGGGRCNVTHACFDPARLVSFYPRGGQALRGAFARFQPGDMVKWFAEHGVTLKTEPDGRMFPASNSAETVIACFLQEANRLGIELSVGAPVARLERRQEDYTAVVGDAGLGLETHYQARRVLLTTGGDRKAYSLAQGLGHTIVPPVPSLFTFSISDPRLAGLAGISVDPVQLRLPESGLEQSGPLLITHWGLSGPAVLKLSAWGARALNAANYQASLLVNWLPAYHPDSLHHFLSGIKTGSARQKVLAQSPAGKLPQRLWERLAQSAGIREAQTWGDLSRQQLTRLVEELVCGQYNIQGKGAFKDEFVTCGGVSLDEVNFKTMESRLSPGLYFAGEVLDIDGLTGGFNFQRAWTTGWLAGQAIAHAG
jgi:predicted Rossmann fold flavoprotein